MKAFVCSATKMLFQTTGPFMCWLALWISKHVYILVRKLIIQQNNYANFITLKNDIIY